MGDNYIKFRWITTTSFNEDMLKESKGVKSKLVLKIARMLLNATLNINYTFSKIL